MKRLSWMRFVVYGLLVVAALLGGAKFYLSSSHAAAKVAARLGAVVGMPVRVAAVDIGLGGGSSMRGVEILEADSGGPQTAWLTVQDVRADVSAADIVAGDTTPKELTLTGAAIQLRFGADGKLLTRMPSSTGAAENALPTLHVEQGKITFLQEGSENPFVVQNVSATGVGAGRILSVTGTVEDAYWGNWTIKGSLDLARSRMTLQLHCDGATLSEDRLRHLPFVPSAVWEQVRVDEGVTPVDFTLTADQESPDVHFRIALEPRDMRLRIACVDLDVAQVQGHVVIEDKRVELRGVTGASSGGVVTADADLDFRSDVTRLHFETIRLDGVDLHKLPASWDLKDYQISGKLTGRANVDLELAANGRRTSTRGAGQGLITDASFRKLPISEPIKLNLHVEAGKLRLRPEKTPVGLLPGCPLPDAAVLLAVAFIAMPDGPADKTEVADSPDTVTPSARAVSRGLGDGLHQTSSLLSSGAAALGQLLNRSAPPPGPEPTYLDAELSLKDVDLRKTVEQLGLELPFPVAGRLTIRMTLGVPTDTPKDFKAYRLRGTADLPTLSVAGVDMTNVHAEVRLNNGVLRLESLKATVAGAPLSGGAELTLDGDYPFHGKVDLSNFGLDALQRLSPTVRLPVALQGSLAISAEVGGELRSQKFSARGTASANDLIVETVRLDSLRFNWDAAVDQVRLNDIRAKLYQGEVTGTVSVPLRDAAAGAMNLQVREVDTLALSKALPAIPVRLEGRVSGSMTATMPAAAKDKPRDLAAKVELTAPRLRVQNLPAQKLRGDVTYRAGRTTYQLEGETLGGTFKLDGQFPPAEGKKVDGLDPEEQALQSKEKPDGRLTLDGVRLSRLGEALGISDALGPLGGRLTASLDYRHIGPNFAVGTGRARLLDLRWGERTIVEEVTSDLRLTGGELQFRNVTGLIGEGGLRGMVSLNLRQSERSHFVLNLERVDADRILAPFPSLVGVFAGSVAMNLRGSLGRDWRASGSMALTRGQFLGLGITEWRMPVSFSYSPVADHGEFAIRDSVADIARGRATGGVSVSWGTGTRIEGSFRFFNADFEALASRTSSLRSVAVGKVTGKFDFASQDFRTVDDLNGVLEARLAQSQALELPVLNDLVPFIAPGRSATTFQSGDVHARLARGTFRVQRLSLVSPALRVVVEGSVGLNGRLDLNTTAQTGDAGVNTTGLRLLARAVPAVGPVPVALIAQASTLLANRVVHLRVTGTTRSPIVRVDPVALLTEEAVRIFVTSYLVPLPGTAQAP